VDTMVAIALVAMRLDLRCKFVWCTHGCADCAIVVFDSY
jgi:hypothetical protein